MMRMMLALVRPMNPVKRARSRRAKKRQAHALLPECLVLIWRPLPAGRLRIAVAMVVSDLFGYELRR